MGDEGDSAPAVAPARQQAAQDLLADLFGGGAEDAPSSSAAAAPAPRPSGGASDVMDLLGGGSDLTAAAPPAEPPSATAYDANGLRLTFTASKDPKQATVTNLTALFTATEEGVQGINLQAAVPKVRVVSLLCWLSCG